MRIVSLSLILLLLAAPAVAADPAQEQPYWASLRVAEANMRVGPGEDYRINWVYHQSHLPMKVLRTMQGWRLVQDPDGARGWMLARFLTRERMAMVRAKPSAELHEQASLDSKLMWRLSHGVVGKLGSCGQGWCALTIERRKGYLRQDQLWGV